MLADKLFMRELALITLILSAASCAPPKSTQLTETASSSLRKTQMTLNIPELRQKAAAQAGQPRFEEKLDHLTRGNEAQKHRLVEFVSDEVVPWMIQEAGNDRAKLKTMIHELQTDRKKFLRTRLPASLKARGDVLIQQIMDEQDRENPPPDPASKR